MNLKGDIYSGLPKGLTPENLALWQAANADRMEEAFRYQEELSEEDLNKFRTEFADEAIELNAQKEEMKEEIKVLKGRVKDIENRMASKLKVIADKTIEIVEPAFGFKDLEDVRYYFCNSQGIIISSRLLEQEEMQMSIPMQKIRSLHKKKDVNEVEEPF